MIGMLFEGFTSTIWEVAIALAPVIVTFILFQIFILKLPKRQVRKIATGITLSFFGLVFFLQGVHIGFLPLGEAMGKSLGALEHNWILIPIGFLMGYSVIMAEPAVLVLNAQVEEVSGGHINKKVMLYTVCIGVAVAVALAMVRVLYGISLWYFIVPGYIIALSLTRFVSSEFVGIAFDAGGAATGPMTVTLISSMAVGVAMQIEGRNPLIDGFGVVALVALAPILTVQILGFLYGRKEKKDGRE